MCWIAVLANLNVSAQVALPDWVRGRGLAMYVTIFFGTMTLGSALWGEVASLSGLPMTHFLAATGALIAVPLTAHWKLQTAAGLDLTPSMHWPEPVVTENVENDAGPVMVTVEYHIDPKDREDFLSAVEKIEYERKRDGAYAWGIFRTLPTPGASSKHFSSILDRALTPASACDQCGPAPAAEFATLSSRAAACHTLRSSRSSPRTVTQWHQSVKRFIINNVHIFYGVDAGSSVPVQRPIDLGARRSG